MQVDKYLQAGRELKLYNHSDGCTLIGWLISDKYTPACWAHDFGRRGLIEDLGSQHENDTTFEAALRQLGMNWFGRKLIYLFVRAQWFFQSHMGINHQVLISLVLIISFVTLAMCSTHYP